MSYRLCYDCRHITCDYDPGWSELTPGSGLTFECAKKHWRLGRDMDRKDLKRALEMAPTCPDFEVADE